MGKAGYMVILSIVLLVIYFFSINYICTFFGNNPGISLNNNGPNNLVQGGSNVQLGVSEGVSVSVVRNRWYGTMLEENGVNRLYLFKFIKIPLSVNGFSMFWVHSIVLLILILIPIITFLIDERRFTGYEKLA